MLELTPLELKKKLLEILIFIDCFCRKNNIDYSLDGGTLIGAVRHKGFIPWDDDIDIMMSRPNYDKFVSLFEDKINNYQLLCYEKDKNTFFPFAKVCDCRTLKFEYGVNTGHGIDIDIFPVDGFDINKNVYWYKYILELFRGLMVIKKYGQRLIKDNFLYHILGICLKPIPMYILSTICQKIVKGFDYNISHYTCILSGYNQNKTIHQKDLYQEYIEINFEGYIFKAVKNYDLFLSKLYGDYMKLPRVEEQTPKHTAKGFYIS
jgi:lipopolysaccharide cholinephosphotransferase